MSFIFRDKLLEKGYILGKSKTDETVVIIDEVEDSDSENACDNDSDTNGKNECNLISAGEKESWIWSCIHLECYLNTKN